MTAATAQQRQLEGAGSVAICARVQRITGFRLLMQLLPKGMPYSSKCGS
jgi:hypothetical protein